MNAPDPLAAGLAEQAVRFQPGPQPQPGYTALGERFFARVAGTPLPQPRLALFNHDLAHALGLRDDAASHPDMLATLAGNRPWPGVESIATVYSGHQFGVWAGQLGDGRALLLAEVRDREGSPREIQLKGAGQTPFSRRADGRAVLRSSIREYLASEAMAGLGIPTTRALALVTSPAPVLRETVETAAVVTRVAPSFLRFGHFEHFYWHQQHDELRELTDYAIDRFFPQLREAANPYQALLQEVARRTAALIAQWQSVGFCHGVMNTDNMSLLGLTLDYGPYGFLDAFDANHICNHSDDQGRYAYRMQPGIGEWNCYCLGQALLPLIGEPADAQAALAIYRPEYQQRLAALTRAKLGLRESTPEDERFFESLWSLLHTHRIDFTRFFRGLSEVHQHDDRGDAACRDLFIDRAAFDAWVQNYRARLRSEAFPDAQRALEMNRVNPKFVLRNHLAELAIRAMRDQDQPDEQPMRDLLKVLAAPFDEHPDHSHLAELPPGWASDLSVSCSS